MQPKTREKGIVTLPTEIGERERWDIRRKQVNNQEVWEAWYKDNDNIMRRRYEIRRSNMLETMVPTSKQHLDNMLGSVYYSEIPEGGDHYTI